MIVSVCAQKGGSGKTTIAVNLAGEAARRGHKTLLIDADPQGSATRWFEQASEETAEAWPDLLQVPSKDVGKEIRKHVKDFDVIVVDCPPQLHEITESAITLSHVALIPISPSALDLWAMLDHTIRIFQKISTKRPDLKGLKDFSTERRQKKGYHAGDPPSTTFFHFLLRAINERSTRGSRAARGTKGRLNSVTKNGSTLRHRGWTGTSGDLSLFNIQDHAGNATVFEGGGSALVGKR